MTKTGWHLCTRSPSNHSYTFITVTYTNLSWTGRLLLPTLRPRLQPEGDRRPEERLTAPGLGHQVTVRQPCDTRRRAARPARTEGPQQSRAQQQPGRRHHPLRVRRPHHSRLVHGVMGVGMVSRRVAQRSDPAAGAREEVSHEVLQQCREEGVSGTGPGDRGGLLGGVQQKVAEVVQVELERPQHQRAAPQLPAARGLRTQQRPVAGGEGGQAPAAASRVRLQQNHREEDGGSYGAVTSRSSCRTVNSVNTDYIVANSIGSPLLGLFTPQKT